MTGNGPDPLVTLRDVSKTYALDGTAVRALRGISMEVGAGEFVVVLGPSGSGKTTLLNLIGGLDRPTSGELRVGGSRLDELSEKDLTAFRRRTVGFIFQFFNLVPTLTAMENVELVGDIQGREVHDEAEKLLEAVGLGDMGARFPSELSGGEQQRVAIARALVKGADLYLCDEPTGNLDSASGRAVLELLHRSSRERGLAFIVVTHNAAISRIADRVIRVGSGRIESDERQESPANPSDVEW